MIEPTVSRKSKESMTCLVNIPFGTKVDFRTGRMLDMDLAYAKLVKPALDRAGIRCFRYIDVQTTGSIDRSTYHWLYHADIVVTDLSTLNANVVYELGVRMALRPNSSLLIGDADSAAGPVDLFSGQRTLTYEHLGDTIADEEARRFVNQLYSEVMAVVYGRSSNPNPVYENLPGLEEPRHVDPTTRAQTLETRLAETAQKPRDEMTCLVLSGFGKMTDLATGRILDLDLTFDRLVKPAVESVGIRCGRIIDLENIPFDALLFKWIWEADVVVADISTMLPTVLFHLGVRHAQRPHTTLIIAELDTFRRLPFDLSHWIIYGYRHDGETIADDEALRFVDQLSMSLQTLMYEPLDYDGPVYGNLPGLLPPEWSGPEDVVGEEPESQRQAAEPQARRSAPQDSEPASDRKAVYVSYKWGGESEAIVDEIMETLEGALAERGIDLVRDKQDLAYKGNVRGFMDGIGRGECVIVVISDGYLRSRNCMYELNQIAANGQFYDRIFPIVLEDADIYDPASLLDYVEYWENEAKALDERLRTLDSQRYVQDIHEQVNLYDTIRRTMSSLLSTLKRMNALTPEAHRASGFDKMLDAIEAQLAPRASG